MVVTSECGFGEASILRCFDLEFGKSRDIRSEQADINGMLLKLPHSPHLIFGCLVLACALPAVL